MPVKRCQCQCMERTERAVQQAQLGGARGPASLKRAVNFVCHLCDSS